MDNLAAVEPEKEKASCSTYKCSFGNYLPEQLRSKSCSEDVCTEAECCEERGVCSSLTCPSTSFSPDPSKRCAGKACTEAECCEERGVCSSIECPAAENKVSRDTSKRCAGKECTKDECCQCSPGYELKGSSCSKCGNSIPTVEGIRVGTWKANKCEYVCRSPLSNFGGKTCRCQRGLEPAVRDGRVHCDVPGSGPTDVAVTCNRLDPGSRACRCTNGSQGWEIVRGIEKCRGPSYPMQGAKNAICCTRNCMVDPSDPNECTCTKAMREDLRSDQRIEGRVSSACDSTEQSSVLQGSNNKCCTQMEQ